MFLWFEWTGHLEYVEMEMKICIQLQKKKESKKMNQSLKLKHLENVLLFFFRSAASQPVHKAKYKFVV